MSSAQQLEQRLGIDVVRSKATDVATSLDDAVEAVDIANVERPAGGVLSAISR